MRRSSGAFQILKFQRCICNVQGKNLDSLHKLIILMRVIASISPYTLGAPSALPDNAYVIYSHANS